MRYTRRNPSVSAKPDRKIYLISNKQRMPVFLDVHPVMPAFFLHDDRNEFADPLVEDGKKMPHCFVAGERTDPVARKAFLRLTAFLDQHCS